MSDSEINGYQPYYKTNKNNKVTIFVLLFIAINTLVLFLRLMEERVYFVNFHRQSIKPNTSLGAKKEINFKEIQNNNSCYCKK